MRIALTVLACLALLTPAGDAAAADPASPPSEAAPSDAAPADAEPDARPSDAQPSDAKPAEPDGKAAQPGAAPAEPRPASPPEKEDSWIDYGHSYIEDKVFAPVFRVDRFFSDERDLEADRARSFLRWRNQFRFAENRDLPTYTTSVNANLRFPGLNKQLSRLHIEVLGQTRDTISTVFPRSNPTPGEIPSPDTTSGSADAGVALRLWDSLQTHADLGAGIMLDLWPPGTYARLRFRFAQQPGLGFVSRQALTTFWRTDTNFGETASADLERPLAPWAVARVSGSTTITEASRRFDWLGDVSVAGAVGRLGAAVGWGVTGATKQPVPVSSHRFYVRVRRDFYRRWIFLELEPEYAWPYTPELGRRAVFAVMLRAEFQFQGNEGRQRPARKGPPPDPEPRDPAPGNAEPPGPAPREPSPAGGSTVPQGT